MGNSQSSSAGGRLSSLLSALDSSNDPLTVKSPLFHALADLQQLTPNEVWASLPTAKLRRALRENPDNACSLVRGLVRELRVRLKLSHVELAKTGLGAGLANVVRLLTRIMPLVLEDESISDRILWSGEDPLGPHLIDTVVALCFLPGYTLGSSAASAGSTTRNAEPGDTSDTASKTSILPASSVWVGGVGVSSVHPCPQPLLNNRTEALRLTLCCLAADLYCQPTNKLLAYLCSQPSYYSLALLLSTMNTAIAFDPSGGSYFFSSPNAGPAAHELASLSLQVLNVLLQFGAPTISIATATPTATGSSAGGGDHGEVSGLPHAVAAASPLPSNAGGRDSDAIVSPRQRRGGASDGSTERGSNGIQNVFTAYLRNLDEDDVVLLLTQTVRLLRAAPIKEPGFFGSSVGQFTSHNELLLFLLRVLHESPAHIALLVRRLPVLELTGILLGFILQSRNEPSDLGLVHLCAFLLLMLSGEREFGVAINAPVEPASVAALAAEPGIVSTADFLVMTVCRVFVDGQPKLASIYELLLTIVANVTPYVTQLSGHASTKLVQLFCMLGRDKYVFGAESNHRLIMFLLESFNNQIQYQYRGAVYLVYNLVQRCDQVVRLANLALPEEGGGAAAEPPSRDAKHANLIDPSFVPTHAWLTEWKNELPFGTVLRLLDHLVPLTKKCKSSTEMNVISLIENTNVVGLLPVPHPLLTRKWTPNVATNQWIVAAIWAVNYLTNFAPPLFLGTNVRLFSISIEEK